MGSFLESTSSLFNEAEYAGRASWSQGSGLMVRRGYRDLVVTCHGALSEWNGSTLSVQGSDLQERCCMIVCRLGLVPSNECGVENGVFSVGRWRCRHALGRRWTTGERGWRQEKRIAAASERRRSR